jgi:hypothetical protein
MVMTSHAYQPCSLRLVGSPPEKFGFSHSPMQMPSVKSIHWPSCMHEAWHQDLTRAAMQPAYPIHLLCMHSLRLFINVTCPPCLRKWRAGSSREGDRLFNWPFSLLLGGKTSLIFFPSSTSSHPWLSRDLGPSSLYRPFVTPTTNQCK